MKCVSGNEVDDRVGMEWKKWGGRVLLRVYVLYTLFIYFYMLLTLEPCNIPTLKEMLKKKEPM